MTRLLNAISRTRLLILILVTLLKNVTATGDLHMHGVFVTNDGPPPTIHQPDTWLITDRAIVQ